jgi:hypothetical protein
MAKTWIRRKYFMRVDNHIKNLSYPLTGFILMILILRYKTIFKLIIQSLTLHNKYENYLFRRIKKQTNFMVITNNINNQLILNKLIVYIKKNYTKSLPDTQTKVLEHLQDTHMNISAFIFKYNLKRQLQYNQYKTRQKDQRIKSFRKSIEKDLITQRFKQKLFPHLKITVNNRQLTKQNIKNEKRSIKQNNPSYNSSLYMNKRKIISTLYRISSHMQNTLLYNFKRNLKIRIKAPLQFSKFLLHFKYVNNLRSILKLKSKLKYKKAMWKRYKLNNRIYKKLQQRRKSVIPMTLRKQRFHLYTLRRREIKNIRYQSFKVFKKNRDKRVQLINNNKKKLDFKYTQIFDQLKYNHERNHLIRLIELPGTAFKKIYSLVLSPLN